MAPPANPASETSETPLLRLLIFLGLIVASLSITGISTLYFNESPSVFLLIGIHLVVTAIYLIELIDSILLTRPFLVQR